MSHAPSPHPQLTKKNLLGDGSDVAAQGIVSGGGITPGAPEQSSFTSPWLVWVQTHSPQHWSPSAKPDEMLGYAVSSQLLATLTHIGNVVMIDYVAYKEDPDRFPGIFKIRGTVTQFTETDGLVEKKKGFSTGPIGGVISFIGAAAGVPEVANIGTGLGMINAGKKTTTTTRTGMVGINLQIIQMDNGRIFAPLSAQGTFTTRAATEIKHGLGLEESQAEYRVSALDQASQMAINDAVMKVWEILKRQASTQAISVSKEAP